MHYIEDLSEHEMIAVFLQTEIRAERYAAEIVQLLERSGLSRAIIDEPDITNATENTYRLQLMTDFRGYGRRQGYFQQFPNEVAWRRVTLSPDELLGAKYIDWDYWVELSGGSRRPADAARNILAGRRAFDVANDGLLALADALRKGATFPELILVWAGQGSDLVVLEGHARLTAYALVPEKIPLQLSVIVGISADMAQWGLY